MKLIFEKSVPGRRCTILPPCDVDAVSLPESLRRETKPDLPQLSASAAARVSRALRTYSARRSWGCSSSGTTSGSRS